MEIRSFRGLGTVWVSASQEIFRNLIILECLFFPYFFRTMGIHSSHALGIAWISVSREIFKKPLTFECLCFPICFPYCGNSLSPCFAIVWINRKNLFKSMSEKDMSIFHEMGKKFSNFFKNPQPGNDMVHSQTSGIA